MNREREFRAWDKENKKMLSWEDILSDRIDIGEGYECEMPIHMLACNEAFIWMDYINLHDKNDKKIFEGDIIKTDVYWISKKDNSVNEHNIYIGNIVFCRFEWEVAGFIKTLDSKKSIEGRYLSFSDYISGSLWGNGWENWNSEFEFKTRYTNIEVIGNIWENPGLVSA